MGGPATLGATTACFTTTNRARISSFAPGNVGDSLQQALDSFFGFLPNLLGFLVILVIGYIIARARARLAGLSPGVTSI